MTNAESLERAARRNLRVRLRIGGELIVGRVIFANERVASLATRGTFPDTTIFVGAVERVEVLA